MNDRPCATRFFATLRYDARAIKKVWANNSTYGFFYPLAFSAARLLQWLTPIEFYRWFPTAPRERSRKFFERKHLDLPISDFRRATISPAGVNDLLGNFNLLVLLSLLAIDWAFPEFFSLMLDRRWVRCYGYYVVLTEFASTLNSSLFDAERALLLGDGVPKPWNVSRSIIRLWMDCWICVLGFGAIYFGLHERFHSGLSSFSEAVYFSTITAFTIGYGDNYPNDGIARAAVMVQISMSFLYFGFAFQRFAGMLSQGGEKQVSTAVTEQSGDAPTSSGSPGENSDGRTG